MRGWLDLIFGRRAQCLSSYSSWLHGEVRCELRQHRGRHRGTAADGTELSWADGQWYARRED